MNSYSLMVFIIYLAQALIAWQYFDLIFTHKYNSTMTLLGIFIGYCVMFLSFQSLEFFLNVILFFVLNVILIKLLYQTSYKNILFHATIMTALMAGSEVVVVFLLRDLNLVSTADEYEIAPFIMTAVLSRTLYYVILKIIGDYFGKKLQQYKTSISSCVLLCLLPTISAVICVIFSYLSHEFELSNSIQLVISFTMIIVLVVNLLVCSIYYKAQELNELNFNLRLQMQKESNDIRYYKLLSEQNQKQRILIHDISKHLQTLRDLCSKEDHSDMSHYIDEIQASDALKQQVEFCNNPTMNLILNRYMQLFREKGIDFHSDVKSASLESLSVFDITAIFSNLLENAYEATERGEDSFVELTCSCSKEQNLATFSLVNSCYGTVNIENDNGVLSTKSDRDRHGIGLKSVHNIVEKHRGWMRLYFNDSDSTFHAVITIPSISL